MKGITKMINKIRLFIDEKLNSSNERSVNAIKNIIASFGIKGVSIVVQLLLVPMTIHYVNPTQYGIWLTLSSIIGWFSFFDIGFGNGLRNRFAEAKATGNYDKAKSYVSTAYICIGAIFAIIWILFFVINFFIDWSKILNAPTQMARELSIVALIVISFFCLQMILKLINTVLIADQKTAKSAFFDMLGQIIALLIIFILTKTTYGSLIYLALALGFCPILVMLFSSFWFYNRNYKQFKPKICQFEKNIVNDILRLGGKFFFIQIGVMVIYQTNNIVISQVCGPNDVTIYNVAFKYFSMANMIFTIILVPYWSAFTDAYSLKDYNWMKNSRRQLEKVCLLLSILLLIMLIFSNLFFQLWVGNSVKVPFQLSLLICFYILLMLRSSIHLNILNGIGKIKIQMWSNLFLCVLNIPITVILGLRFGLNGVVIGNILMILPNIIWAPMQTNLILKNEASGIWNK